MNNLITKSFLSYADLKKQAQLDVQVDMSEAETGEIRPTNQENLSLFFQEVEAIRSQMEEICNLLHDLQSLNEDAKSTHSTKILRGLRDRMDCDTVSILCKAKSLKSKLDSLDESNTKNRRISVGFREGSTVDRTRVAVTNGLRVKFKDIIHDFTCLREKIMLDKKYFLTTKYFNATGEMPSEETVDKLMAGSVKIEALHAEDSERNEVMKDVERSLNKLHQVFLAMAVLIERQGDQIDDIEQNVAQAGEFISGGTNSIYYANQLKKSNKNLLVCWVLVVGFFILLVCSFHCYLRASLSSWVFDGFFRFMYANRCTKI